ncbi:acyltransferase domain-containing protein, partial [Streptomyces europaeiscabiei]|uniref:acyltransferase domain-containing protein n=1 Tax=Streptomyces europaeiscabiei TaxID=146819 RepID=UPI000E67B556
DRAVAALTARGVAARRLRVSHAFHSPMLSPVLDPLHNAAKSLTVAPATVPMLSTVTGRWGPDLTPGSGYWRDHAVRPVRFGTAVARLLDEGYDTFVELGPGASLSAPIRATATAQPGVALSDVTVLPALPAASDGREAGSGAGALLETVGRLWTRGAPLSPTAPASPASLARSTARRRVPVPTYPFQRGHHWPERLDTAPGSGTAPAPRTRPVPRTAAPTSPDDIPTPQPLLWRDAPLTAAPAPRVVRLTGADTPLRRALTDRLAGRGVTVLGPTPVRSEGPPEAEETAAVPEAVLWFAGDAPGTGSETGTAVSALREVLRALGTPPTRLLLVTENAYSTGSGDTATPSRPAQALLHGFALALPEEHPGLSSLSVDLTSEDSLDSQLDALERELGTAAPPAPGAGGTVAWRTGRRLARTAVAPTTPTTPTTH